MRIDQITRPIMELLSVGGHGNNADDEETKAQIDPSTVPDGEPVSPEQGSTNSMGQPSSPGGFGGSSMGPEAMDPSGRGQKAKISKKDVELARGHEYLRTSGGSSDDAAALLGMSDEELKDELNTTRAKLAKVEMDTDAGLYDDPEYVTGKARAKFIRDLLKSRN
jgi:hypothetical protein